MIAVMNINHQCNNVPSKLKFHQVWFPFDLYLLIKKKKKFIDFNLHLLTQKKKNKKNWILCQLLIHSDRGLIIFLWELEHLSIIQFRLFSRITCQNSCCMARFDWLQKNKTLLIQLTSKMYRSDAWHFNTAVWLCYIIWGFLQVLYNCAIQ